MTTRYYCEKCDYECFDLSNWKKHEITQKHLGTKKEPTSSGKVLFKCDSCDYTCYKQSLFDKHNLTKSHLLLLERAEKPKQEVLFKCQPCKFVCCKKSAFDRHITTRKHNNREPDSKSETINYASIITQLLQQNSELKNFIIEQSTEHKKETAEIVNKVIEQANEHKKDTIEIVNKVIEQSKCINNNSNNTIINNKAFNINMYLNEQCKDAINFSDFIQRLEVSREDLENNAQLGFVHGISKIIIDSLKTMNKSERPIHCTDLKRETIYIKDDNKWCKEEDSTKLNRAIQTVTSKSIGTLINWRDENPDYEDMDSEFSSRSIVIQQHSMAGHNRDTYYPKVIHAIAKEVLVDK
jgi:hypothetical protein